MILLNDFDQQADEQVEEQLDKQFDERADEQVDDNEVQQTLSKDRNLNDFQTTSDIEHEKTANYSNCNNANTSRDDLETQADEAIEIISGIIANVQTNNLQLAKPLKTSNGIIILSDIVLNESNRDFLDMNVQSSELLEKNYSSIQSFVCPIVLETYNAEMKNDNSFPNSNDGISSTSSDDDFQSPKTTKNTTLNKINSTVNDQTNYTKMREQIVLTKTEYDSLFFDSKTNKIISHSYMNIIREKIREITPCIINNQKTIVTTKKIILYNRKCKHDHCNRYYKFTHLFDSILWVINS